MFHTSPAPIKQTNLAQSGSWIPDSAIEFIERLEGRRNTSSQENDDEELENIFQGVRGIRERTPLREHPERPELNRGLSGADFDEQETEQKSPQRCPFRSKYSIFYPKMCQPSTDKNENTTIGTSQGQNELGREANEDEAKNEDIKQGQRKENMKEGVIEEENANDQENTCMAELE